MAITAGTSLDVFSDITECHSHLRWLQNYEIPCRPSKPVKNQSKTYDSKAYTHTHTSHLPKGGKVRETFNCVNLSQRRSLRAKTQRREPDLRSVAASQRLRTYLAHTPGAHSVDTRMRISGWRLCAKLPRSIDRTKPGNVRLQTWNHWPKQCSDLGRIPKPVPFHDRKFKAKAQERLKESR